MSVIITRASNSISISNFYEDHSIGKYNMAPAYQRHSIWSVEKQSFFIDSVLKNLPIPPIFLRVKLDEDTGKTTYDVIDGKQRLTSIIGFINNDFSCSSEQDDPLADDLLAGKYFSDLSSSELLAYKKQFWTYAIPVEYIDVTDDKVIDGIFDRLNRNGEPLNGQELRHSQYYDSKLLNLSYELVKLPFWAKRLEITDKTRMEDVEFISELVLTIIEGEEFTSTSDVLDQLYSKHGTSSLVDWEGVRRDFMNVTEFISKMDIDFNASKVGGVSHLYGLWCFSIKCVQLRIEPNAISLKIKEFLIEAKNRGATNEHAREYKISMSSRTKYKGNRIKRKNALLGFCGIGVD
jgi:hypothetical protein